MGDRMTETFEPYRPDSSYDDLDYDDEPPPGKPGRVLWGRVAILGAALLIAFLFGRATGGGDGIPEADYDEVVAERDDLEAQVSDLESDLAAALEPTPPPASASPAAGGGGDTGGEEATDPEGETEGGQTYTVKPGDTLALIALEFYEDASYDDFLAEVNGITDPESLAVGQELTIPDDPEP